MNDNDNNTINDEINVDDLVGELPEWQKLTALSRVLRRFDISYQFDSDGGLEITDSDIYNFDGLMENNDFVAAMGEELKLIVASNMTIDLQQRGLIAADHVDNNGEIVWKPCEGCGAWL